MIENSFLYTTPEQQLIKLKSQNLSIENEENAKEALSVYGYSNLIKSYREPYVIVSEGKKIYRSGVTFEQVRSLYILDKNLRNAVMASMLDLEEHIKETAADVISSSFGIRQDEYLNYKNYRNKHKSKERFSLSGILGTMQKTLDTDKDPIHHYAEKYGIVPPWILFKSIYFSTIVNFINLFKIDEQEDMVQKLYNTKILQLPLDSMRKLMMDTLFICLEYRNTAAHGGRTYNFVCKCNLRKEEIFGTSSHMQIAGISQLLFLLELFRYQAPHNHLEAVLRQQVNRHCTSYPQDTTYLGQILNMNIVSRDIVFVSERSKKYHNTPYCSGIKDAAEMDLEEALKQGYIPCKRCYHNPSK